MIRLSRAARIQIAELAQYYVDLDRPEAVRNLRTTIGKAGVRILARRGSFFPAPRPYPTLARAGWVWLKEGPYWIAYVAAPEGAVIQVVFHEAADMPGRV